VGKIGKKQSEVRFLLIWHWK